MLWASLVVLKTEEDVYLKDKNQSHASRKAKSPFVIPREVCPYSEFTSLRRPTEDQDVLSLDVAGKIKGS